MKHFNKAEKDIELGERIGAKNIYERNGTKPWQNPEKTRYSMREHNTPCVYIGKRVINYKGYTDMDESYYFCPVEKWTVHLVAISKQRLAYVIDEDII